MAEKNLIGELDMYREAGIKPNFSDIAKRYGKDRHTVAAYWRAEGGRPRDGRADRAGSFDAHIEEVAAKAQLPGVTKKGIHEWLLHRYPGENLAGYNAFTQFMRKNGIAVGASVGPEPHPRFETPPGLQLQFDWKESVRMANRDGELFEFNVFAATLGHSRRHIFIRSGTRTTDDLVRCMYATIARLGGVPREWVTDNMSALVTVKGGRRLKVQRAYEFAKAAGFELKLCRPRSPQTKGKVESSNRFLSRLAAYQGDFDGWDDIDEIIARIEDASNSEPNETTGLPPSALFMEEKDALLPVGNLRALEEAMGDVVRVARVPATMLVSAHGEPMSVPRRCIGRPARVVCMPGGAMDCYVGGELVATHVAGGPAYDPAHYAEAMAGKRWFGDAAGDIEAAAAANLGLLDSIGGLAVSAAVQASPLNRLAANLEELGLEGMASSVPEYVRLVADGRKSLVDAMLELTDAQIALKRRADDERRTRMANFPYIKTLADFDWGFQPSVPRGLVEQLATLEFVDRGDNVVLVGSPGVGKTHLSIAIGHEAVMARKQVYFADCSRLVEDLKHASAKEALARRMRFYEHCSLLIIDELGYLDIGKEGADLLFQLVNRRYALKRSTIVTTNVPVGRWGDVFGSNVTASAVADRLCHHCAMIKITGRSYRLKDVSIGGEDGKEEGA